MTENKIQKKERNKKFTFFSSVSFSLSLKFSIVLTVFLLILSVSFSLLLSSFIRLSKTEELERALTSMEKTIQKEGISEDLNFPDLPYYITYSVYDRTSQTVFKTNDPFLPLSEDTEKKSIHYVEKDFFIDGDMNILYMAKNISSDGKITIIAAQNMDADASSGIVKGIPRAIFMAILPAMLLSFFISLLITRRTMKPVIKMTETARKISAANLSQKLPQSNHNNELDELAQTFNSLFEKLEADFARERQFTSDVSHELKTPIAVILGQTNLLRRWGKEDPTQTEKSLGIILKEAHSMESIVNNLLQLSRIESGRIQLHKENFQLQELFDRIKTETESLDSSCIFEIENTENIELFTDQELVHQVMIVCISNSLKFMQNEKKIKTGYSVNGKFIILYIHDKGPGFPEGSQEKVFERFYRADESHSRKIAGSGLGLSIAKAICQSLDGNIKAFNSTEDKGAVVEISLPLR